MEMILIYNQCAARHADFLQLAKNQSAASVKSPGAE